MDAADPGTDVSEEVVQFGAGSISIGEEAGAGAGDLRDLQSCFLEEGGAGGAGAGGVPGGGAGVSGGGRAGHHLRTPQQQQQQQSHQQATGCAAGTGAGGAAAPPGAGAGAGVARLAAVSAGAGAGTGAAAAAFLDKGHYASISQLLAAGCLSTDEDVVQCQKLRLVLQRSDLRLLEMQSEYQRSTSTTL
jgi:hypothetical protein